ncbi:MAG: SBBP repeat-containing protein [Bacteroidia bacterium]|nr:SBBP repeat-containing protein [Bacteroidia bacterium]
MKKQLRFFRIPALIVASVGVFAQNIPITIEMATPDAAGRSEALKTLNVTGMLFTKNEGQVADINGNTVPSALFKSQAKGVDIYLRKTGFSYVFSNQSSVLPELDNQLETANVLGFYNGNEEKIKRDILLKTKLRLHRIDMDFENINLNIAVQSVGMSEAYENFYNSHCLQGITNVRSFNKIIYKNIYNKIDVKFTGSTEKGLKYDLIIHPGGNPSDIKLKYSGAEAISIINEKLRIRTSINEYEEYIPKAYQIINGQVVDVKAKYVLNGTMVSFAFESVNRKRTWDPEFPLIIDPATWITYYGGNGVGQEEAGSVAADALGNSIYSGRVSNTGFPVSTGAAQVMLGGSIDAFVVKMNPVGGRVFSTYFGGTGFDTGEGIDTDINNDIILTGGTYSANLPTKIWGAAFMKTIFSGGGGADAYIAKFSSTGTLIWSTYYGAAGVGDDWGVDITSDGLGNIVFAGYTSSAAFPTQAPFQLTLNGPIDGFVVKFSNMGVRQWATFYGGSNPGGVVGEFIYGITVDPLNNIYACGKTNSNSFPVVLPYQPSNAGALGSEDAFIFRLNPTTGFPDWSTYYGGPGQDAGTAIATDGLGNVFLALSSTSALSITTAGTFQTTLNGPQDAALIKFAANTGMRIWGTYIGGSIGSVNPGLDYPTGLDVDSRNNIVISGDTYSSDFPVTACSSQPTFKGTEDIFISTFNQQAKLICSGVLGENLVPHNETYYRGGSIAVSGSFVFLHAWSYCNFPVTQGAYQTLCGGSSDVVFAKLCIYSCGIPNTTASFVSANNVCIGIPVNFTLSYISCDTTNSSYLWTFTGAVPGTSNVQQPTHIIWNSPGTFPVSVTIFSKCDTTVISYPNYISVTNCGCTLTAQYTKGTANCSNCGCKEWIMVNATGGTAPYSYTWSDGYVNRYKNGLCPGAYLINVKDKNGCSVNLNVNAP